VAGPRPREGRGGRAQSPFVARRLCPARAKGCRAGSCPGVLHARPALATPAAEVFSDWNRSTAAVGDARCSASRRAS
jgi:hypothetical protein